VILLAVGFMALGCTSSRGGALSSPSAAYPIPTGPTGHVKIAPIPEGTYRVIDTRADAIRLGVEKCVGPDLAENTGHIALTLSNGHFRWDISAAHVITHHHFTGIYTGTERRVTLHFDPNSADEGKDTLRWSLDGRFLHFKVVSALPEDLQGHHLCGARLQYESHPWLKTS
jgi:hypothetical protein